MMNTMNDDFARYDDCWREGLAVFATKAQLADVKAAVDKEGTPIEKDAYALADTVSAAWVAFARTGNPNVKALPTWPAYSDRRDTMLFNNVSRVVQDPDREPRLIMEKVLKL